MKHKSGVALVIVLTMLVLLSVLIIAFMSSVATDRAASQSYLGGVATRELADSAVNLVIGQIREGSTQAHKAWISQPGLIRTFDTDGAPAQAFKLYSAETMVEDGSFDPARSPDLPTETNRSVAAHWSRQPALWTDLNAPVVDTARLDSTGKPLLIYPILDGNHFNSKGELALNKADRSVEGFWVEQFEERAVEMPVRWLYVLQDGTILPAQAGAKATDAVIQTATIANPIVARMAFWTDDESAKVNINTASEGTFWDTPVCNSQPGVAKPAQTYQTNVDRLYEWDLAERIGAINEYQRYPGHPATTSLSPIFGAELARSLGLSLAETLEGPTRQTFVEQFMKLAPRVAGKNYNTTGEAALEDYSSRGGTARAGTDQNQHWQAVNDPTVRRVIKDTDRLYATVDELAFKALDVTPATPPERAPTLLAGEGNDDKSREMLEMSKFLLTANSKAPEQNLYNLPRVAIWPVRDQENLRTGFDKLITFCSTVGNKETGTNQFPMLFQRRNPSSSSFDYQGIPGNQRLYAYLQALTGRPVPGWAATAGARKDFHGKYGLDRDQILTEIFDYIRCTNLVDQSDPNIPSAYTDPKITDMRIGEGAPGASSMLSKRGQVTPLVIGTTRGFGRIATISELALVLIRKPDAVTPSPTATIECSLLPQLFSPMAGFSCLANDLRIVFKTISLSVDDLSGSPAKVIFPNVTYPEIYDIGRITSIEDYESKVGGVIGIRSLLEPATPRQPRNRGSQTDSVPPSVEFTVIKRPTESATRLKIRGKVEVEIWTPGDPADAAAEKIQKFQFEFPETTVMLPVFVNQGEMALDPPGAAAGVLGTSKGTRLTANQYHDTIVDNSNNGDVVRAVSPTGVKGDMRLVAARSVIAPTVFSALPGTRYHNEGSRMAHTLRSGWARVHPGFSPGLLVAGMTGYNSNPGGDRDYRPAIPEGILGVTNSAKQPGDWDNGPAWMLDGAYVNKADEGTTRHHHGSAGAGEFAQDAAPYIGYQWVGQDFDAQESSFFSPNRQVASPIMFGSLPTGVRLSRPWQTLLFRPSAPYLPGGINHPGSARLGPPDHLLLDLFWMPVVEPYAISEPFATAGKINLNCQVVPFTNIKRNTGLHAILKAVKITALNPNQPEIKGPFIKFYKEGGTPGASAGREGGGIKIPVRRNIDIENTIRQISHRLDQNKPFVSASEICDIPLIPADMKELSANPGFTPITDSKTEGTSLSAFEAKLAEFWGAHKLTGDNNLERPYSMIYPRLTTRSNTYTVHVRVQSLRKGRGLGNDPTIFTEGRDPVVGDFRGSFIVERYLDPNSAGFIKANGGATTELDPDAVLGPYRFRVISSKQFAQ